MRAVRFAKTAESENSRVVRKAGSTRKRTFCSQARRMGDGTKFANYDVVVAALLVTGAGLGFAVAVGVGLGHRARPVLLDAPPVLHARLAGEVTDQGLCGFRRAF